MVLTRLLFTKPLVERLVNYDGQHQEWGPPEPSPWVTKRLTRGGWLDRLDKTNASAGSARGVGVDAWA